MKKETKANHKEILLHSLKGSSNEEVDEKVDGLLLTLTFLVWWI